MSEERIVFEGVADQDSGWEFAPLAIALSALRAKGVEVELQEGVGDG